MAGENDPVNVLWLSNAPWVPSGYGQQTALFAPRLAAHGHQVTVLCNYGLQGQEMTVGGITCCPSDNQWGNQNLPVYAARYDAELVVALCDAWVLRPDSWASTPPVWCWAPVDHQPAPPAVVEVLKHDRVRPVAMSRFGRRALADAGVDAPYIPHGVDTSVFRPRPEIRYLVRDELGIPHDVFLVGMVAANVSAPVSRKAFPQAFQAFSRFAKRRDDVWLYAHTQPRPFNAGIPLDTLARATGCPDDRVRFPSPEAWDTGFSADAVSAIYQAFDVLISPSMGEGFSLALLEAQACGVPVISSNHSAMTEHVEAGWLVDGDPWWDPVQQAFLINPSVEQIDTVLDVAYHARHDLNIRSKAVEWAQQYDADYLTEKYWLPMLDEATSRPRLELVG
jgi:glycosyltransferase involved in cell wall biosynthesis